MPKSHKDGKKPKKEGKSHKDKTEGGEDGKKKKGFFQKLGGKVTGFLLKDRPGPTKQKSPRRQKREVVPRRRPALKPSWKDFTCFCRKSV